MSALRIHQFATQILTIFILPLSLIQNVQQNAIMKDAKIQQNTLNDFIWSTSIGFNEQPPKRDHPDPSKFNRKRSSDSSLESSQKRSHICSWNQFPSSTYLP